MSPYLFVVELLMYIVVQYLQFFLRIL